MTARLPGLARDENLWPTDVIGRFENRVGATVDVYRKRELLRAVCQGCPDADFVRVTGELERPARKRALREVQEWAQSHAERCTALVRRGSIA